METEVRKYLSMIGKKGGLAGTGKAKARTSEQARVAALERWKRARAKARSKNPRKKG